MADVTQGPEVPQTLEGYYILHDVYNVDWPRWRALDAKTRGDIAASSAHWLTEMAGVEAGDSALYSVLTQKGDLMFLHYRETPEELNRVELSLRQTRLYDFLRPAWSYFSVIELSMYELTAIARKKLIDQGIRPGSDVYDSAFEVEIEKQKVRVRTRLFRKIPEGRFICFYPMNKRRGEQVNWYALSIEQRREMMRNHGRIGHKYAETITQIIGGSVGLDDWEWGVSLHGDDALTFKKLIYEMRFDPASALFAEFGPFYIGIHVPPGGLPELLSGRLPSSPGRETQ
ncbi:MAG: heme-dependent peroxidase [Phycisphaerae bacterium]|nr:heme-dependent peroxidase [Phycisphaerae bacterium]